MPASPVAAVCKYLIIDGNTVTTNWVNVAHACNGMNNDVNLTDVRDDQGNVLGWARCPWECSLATSTATGRQSQ